MSKSWPFDIKRHTWPVIAQSYTSMVAVRQPAVEESITLR
jgi:hypothetical protein